MMGARERGFTLLELLAAVAVFALIAALTYGAVQMAGEGFEELKHTRDALERAGQLDRRLRLDVNWLARSADTHLQTLKIVHDQRGDASFDQLWLLVADESSPSLLEVRYAVDEDRGVLVRESGSAWRRPGVEPVRWDMGKVDSFEVRALDAGGQWQPLWDARNMHALPRAIRVRWRVDKRERELVLPVFLN